MPLFAPLKQLARPSGVVFFAAVGQAIGGLVALGLAYTYADTLRGGGLGVGFFLLIGGALGCGLALLPTHVLSLLSGWAFGLPIGLAVALAGATLGSPLGYAIGRRLAGPGVMQVIARNPKGEVVCKAVAQSSKARAFVLIGLLRLSPVVPYGSTNVLAAVFRVPMAPFVLGTLLGLAPRVAVVVLWGAGLQRLDEQQQASPLFWVIGLGATVLAIVLMGLFARTALRRAIGPAAVSTREVEYRRNKGPASRS